MISWKSESEDISTECESAEFLNQQNINNDGDEKIIIFIRV